MLLLIFGVVIMLGSQAWAADNGKGKGKPPGNNGTVKLDGVEFGPGKGNEPHVGCTFEVDFYNFDAGVGNATVTFTLQAPTRRSVGDQILLTGSVDIGEDPAGGSDDGSDLDATASYTPSFVGVEPHPIQGYHVKLTVNAPGSQGADTKHKVFWTEPCPPTIPPVIPPVPPVIPQVVPPTPPVTPAVAPTVAGVTLTAPATPSVAPLQVLGATETRPAALPRTGAGLQALLFLGGLSIALAGFAFLAAGAGRRRLQLS
jgi:hypothetical protein